MDPTMQPDMPEGRVLLGPTSWRTAAVAAAFAHPEEQQRERWMRSLFAANVLGAGGSGLLMLAAPRTRRRSLFGAARQEPLVSGLLGSLWLALGLASVAGVRNPRPFAGVLAVQALSKGAWLALALPRLLRAGERRALPVAGLAVAWELATLRATPWRALLARPRSQPAGV